MRSKEIEKLEFLRQSWKSRLELGHLCLLVVSQLSLPLPHLNNAGTRFTPGFGGPLVVWLCSSCSSDPSALDHRRNLCLLQYPGISLSPSSLQSGVR